MIIRRPLLNTFIPNHIMQGLSPAEREQVDVLMAKQGMCDEEVVKLAWGLYEKHEAKAENTLTALKREARKRTGKAKGSKKRANRSVAVRPSGEKDMPASVRRMRQGKHSISGLQPDSQESP